MWIPMPNGIFWLFPNRGYTYPPPPPHPPLRSSHLNIKDVQCNENKDGRKNSYHIAFGRCGRPKGVFWAPKQSIFFKGGQIGRADWT